ncbi:MAG: 30S ribosomal protein S3 [Thermoplasmatota archaeon]
MASERKFVAENIRRVLLKEYFMKETEMAGFGGIDIQRTPMGTRVTLTVERPGMVIGRKGVKIKELTRMVSEKYGFDNPQIEVQECRDSSQNPQIMAQKLALALERGWHFRRAGHSTLRRITDSKVKGCQVKLSGKLTGQRHRTEKFKWGHIKFCGEPALTTMGRGYAIAKKKLGLIGVSVDIMKEDAHLPDEITILDLPHLGQVAEVKGEMPSLEVGEKEVEPEEPEEEESPKETEEEPAEDSETKEEKPASKRKQKKMRKRKAAEKKATPDPKETEDAKKEKEPADKKATPGPKETKDAKKEKEPAENPVEAPLSEDKKKEAKEMGSGEQANAEKDEEGGE